MNEAETRAELVDTKLKACGWGIVEGSKIHREYYFTAGKIQAGGRGKRIFADYVLEYKGVKLAVVEAKSNKQSVGEGVMQTLVGYSLNSRDIFTNRRQRDGKKREK